MSYNIIRSIKLDDEKREVIITSASNNVTPRYYTTEPAPYFARIWAEKGREAVEIELVKAFESGNFQGGTSKYKQASDRLKRTSAYREFDWRLNGAEYEQTKANRAERIAEFDALIIKALQTKQPTEKYVITKKAWNGELVYFYHRANAHFCRWFNNVEKAKVFNYRVDAENVKKWFTDSEQWQVIQIA